MREAFCEVAGRILHDEWYVSVPNTSVRRVGLEVEHSCVGPDGPMPETVRDQIIADTNWQREIGATQIEITTPPCDLNVSDGWSGLAVSLLEETARLDAAVEAMGYRTVRHGVNPALCNLDASGRTTASQRYLFVPEFHRAHRCPIAPGLVAGVGASDPYVTTAMCALQLNIDCHSVGEAIALLNQSYATLGYAMAIGANARYVAGQDSGWADVRGPLWEASHDIRTVDEYKIGAPGRVGFPSGYYAGLGDYLTDLYDQPFILNRPGEELEVATGLCWRYARLKFLRRGTADAQIVLEFRPLSLQPNTESDLAMTAFVLGHLFGSLDRPRLSWSQAVENGLMAMQQGMHSQLYCSTRGGLCRLPAAAALAHELPIVLHGLERLRVPAVERAWVERFCWQRIAAGSPSEQLAALLHQGFDLNAALQTLRAKTVL